MMHQNHSPIHPRWLCGLLGLLLAPAVSAEDVPAMKTPPGTAAEAPSAATTDVPPETGTEARINLHQIDQKPELLPELLSLEDLEQIAAANNPTLMQASAIVDVEHGNYKQVGLYPNPRIGYVATQIGDRNTLGQEGAYVEQDIITGKKLKLNRQIAAQSITQAQWQAEQQRYRVINALRLRYYDLLAAQRTVELTEKLHSVAERAADASRQLFKAGEGTRPDVLQAEIEVEQAQILVNNARNQYVASWKQLTAVMAVPSLDPVPVSGSLDGPAPAFLWDDTLEWLLGNSPEMQIAMTSVSRAQWAINRARAEPIPNLNIQASIQRDNGTKANIGNLQMTMPIPIYNRNQGTVYAAHAELRRAQAETERVQLALRDRLAEAFRRYRNALQQTERYKEQIVPRAQESLSLITEGYRRGELTFLQVLFAQRTYFQTNIAYVESLTQLWKSTVDITGLLLTPESEAQTVPTASQPVRPPVGP